MAALCPCVADVAPIPDPTPAPAEAVAAFHIDQLARVIRNEEYPEFKAAPPPDWAVRAAHKIVEFHQGLVLEGVLAADRERYRHGWCCDYDFDNGTYRTTNECISRTRNADAVEAAALTRDHARCDGLREALEAVMAWDGDWSAWDDIERKARAALAAPAASPEACVCGHREEYHWEEGARRRLCDCEGDGKAGLCPCAGYLAPTVAASEEVGPATGPVMPGTNIEAYGAVAIECEHGYDVCPMCDAAPSPATEAER